MVTRFITTADDDEIMAIIPQSLQSRFQVHKAVVINFLKENPTNCLYKPQIDALLSIETSCNPGEIALVVLPTGCGKTGVAALAPYVLGVRNVLVLTPSVIITRQIHEAFCGTGDENPSFYQKRRIVESSAFCPSTNGIILRASQLRDHLAYNNELLVVNVHKIGGRSKVRIEDIDRQKFELVIVDEAHHYPAHMWKTVVDHFHVERVRILFLTATPAPIIPCPIPKPCYYLSRRNAVALGIIRDMDDRNIQEVGDTDVEDLQTACLKIARKVEECLNAHDQLTNREEQAQQLQRCYYHQAMVIAQTTEMRNDADTFQAVYAQEFGDDKCGKYVAGTSRVALDRFDRGKIRTLVVVGKLREGYDNKYVSVVAIVRNIAPTSHVLFAQFIGRAVRKLTAYDPVNVAVISHRRFKQRRNYENFMREAVAEIENDDDQEDLTDEDQNQVN